MIKDLKDLRALFTMCRSKGITEIKLNGLEIKFGELPGKGSQEQVLEDATDGVSTPYANFPQGELTPEQLAFYSSGGIPEEDPFLKDFV